MNLSDGNGSGIVTNRIENFDAQYTTCPYCGTKNVLSIHGFIYKYTNTIRCYCQNGDGTGCGKFYYLKCSIHLLAIQKESKFDMGVVPE